MRVEISTPVQCSNHPIGSAMPSVLSIDHLANCELGVIDRRSSTWLLCNRGRP
jgi:hypothetical protein